MHDWNVIITVQDDGFVPACKFLEEMEPVHRSGYMNVLTMQVDDPKQFLETLREKVQQNPDILSFLGRVTPVASTFIYQTADEFQAKAREAVLAFAPQLAGKTWHVRMHRHGFRGRISSLEEERFLGGVLLEALEKAETPGQVSFQDPDAILVVETLSNRAGLSLWTREEMQRYPFLKLD